MPNVAIESMARSTPVIGSKNSGTEEVIKDNINGYLVDPENIDDIAAKIKTAFSDKKKLKTMGDSAKIHIEENFSFKEMKSNYLRLFCNE